MNRTIEHWEELDPFTEAHYGAAFAQEETFKDARHDILELHGEVERLREVLEDILDLVDNDYGAGVHPLVIIKIAEKGLKGEK